MQLKLHAFDLPLRHTFTISRGSTTVQQTLIVELIQDGHHGYGEATTDDYYGFTLQSMAESLDAVRPQLESTSLGDPARLWEQLAPQLSANSFAQCALDQAAHDLWGKLQGQPVYQLWGLDTRDIPCSDYTIGIDKLDVMVAKLAEFPDWPIYKIKLGTPDDLDIVRELRSHTDAVFRVDANCAWSADETIRNAPELQALGVQFIEQPLAADQWDDMKLVYARSALPVIADESCIVERDVERCHGCFHGINIKLCKCGGLTPARRMIQRARQLGLRVMVGCMTESTVGISAIAQLLPLLDYVDMDGAVLLAEDIATGVSLDRGRCIYPDVNGSGVTLLRNGRQPG
jgi:L-alanine-DL-glutamate epimerase-like enolase superfamily enzyme